MLIPEGLNSAIRDHVLHPWLVIRIAAVLASILVIYYQDLAITFGRALEFNAGNFSNYVLVIPFLIFFILYRKRKILLVTASSQPRYRQSIRLDDVVGVALCLIAVVVYIFGSSALYSEEYHIFSMPVFVAGAILVAFDFTTLRHLIFVLVLLAYLQPPPAELVSELAADLSWGSAVLVQQLLSTFGMPISLDASFGAPALVIGQDNGRTTPFFVGEPSSGAYSTVGLSMFSLFVGYIIRGKFWKRILVFVAGFPVFFLLNTLRIAIIITLWYTSGEQVAETFHTVSGSIMVAVGTLLLLVMAERVLKLTLRSETGAANQQCQFCQKSRSMNESLCLLCGRVVGRFVRRLSISTISRLIIVMLIASSVIFSHIGTEKNEAAAQPILNDIDISSIKGPETTNYFMPNVDGWNVTYAYRDTKIEEILNQDASLAYRYIQVKEGQNSTKLTVFSGLQISRGVHTWEGSLLITPSKFGRPTATALEQKDIDIGGDKQARLFIYQKPKSQVVEAVLYWFEKVELRFGSDFEPRNVQIILFANADSLAKSGAISAPTDTKAIETLLMSLAKPISSYWEEISTQSARNRIVDTFISQQIYLSLVGIIVPALIFSARTYSGKNALLKRNRKLYSRLRTGDEKLVIDAISNAGPKEKLTGEGVANRYQRLAGKSIDSAILAGLLKRIKDAGLIRNQISSNGDVAILTWKKSFADNED